MSTKPAAGFTDGQWQFFDPEEVDAEPVEEPTLNLTDDNNTLTSNTYKTGNVTYTRSSTKIQENYFASFCLPFKINAGSCSTYFKAIYIPLDVAFNYTDNEGKTSIGQIQMFATKATGVIEAGTPFLAQLQDIDGNTVILANSEKVTFDGTNTPITTTIDVFDYDSYQNSNILIKNENITLKWYGMYDTSEIPTATSTSAVYSFIASSGNLGKSKGDYAPFRAYVQEEITGTGSVKEISMSFIDDATTMIQKIQNSTSHSSLYNLRGQMMHVDNINSLPHGVYIRDGKKIIR